MNSEARKKYTRKIFRPSRIKDGSVICFLGDLYLVQTYGRTRYTLTQIKPPPEAA